MAINYPNSLDNFTNPTSSSPINSPSHADQHSNANDAIEALEAKVGVTGSAVSTSHDYKITQLESLVTSAVAGAKSIYQDVRNQSGSSLSKATPVYASGSEGASGKILVSPASNSAESSSSKTIGLTSSAISNNSNGQIISEGILEGVDTTGAVDGDPVWLGPNGTKIFGLVNKPSAPSHLVFLGIVVRGGQANTGSIYVKIQNGFELQELHNVQISSLLNGNILAYDSTSETWKNTNTLQSTASTTPLVIKGSTSQSANLQEWQNSAGTVLAKVDKDGSITSNISFTVNNTSGNAIFSVSPYSEISMPGTIYGGLYASAKLNLLTNNSSTIGIIVRGSASQTANLQEWQNSAGTVLTYINASGGLTATEVVGSTTYSGGKITGGTLGYLNASTFSASVSPIVVRGAASQTANLQEWQNSAGTVLSYMASNGMFVAGSDILTTESINAGNLTWLGGQLNSSPRNASRVGIIVRGYASQTGNLQEWQNSAGTVQARIASNGDFTNNGIFTVYGRFGGASFTDAAALRVNGYDTAVPTAVIKAIASQTANLQEWQNSAGSVLLNVDSTGSLDIGAGSNNIWKIKNQTSTVMEWQPGQGFMFLPYGASNKPVTIKGAASQTANLTEWQNSAGTVLASISPTGKLTSAVDASINGVVIGMGAGSASSNTSVGLNSLVSNTTGTYNTAFGNQSLQLNTSGTQNTAFGQNALYNNRTGWYNTAFGQGALQNNNYAYSNTAIGTAAMITNVSGSGNTAVGIQSLLLNSSGGNNVGIGQNTGFSNSTGSGNIFLGSEAGYYETGSNKLYIANTNTTTPLIGGDFSAKTLTFAGNATITSQNSSSIVLLVKAAASQAGSIIQWQNSSGSTIGEITNQGIFRNTYNYVQNLQGLGGGGGLYLNDVTTTAFNTNPSHLVFKVQGFASQTANLQEWQNSSGTVLASISSAGNVGINTTNPQALLQINNTDGATVMTTTPVVRVIGTTAQNAADEIGLRLTRRGVSSTTYPGTVDFKIGQWTAATPGNGYAPSTVLKIALKSTTSDAETGNADVVTIRDNFTVGINNIAPVANIDTVTTSATRIGIIVKGFASQTANLQEWQDSAGTVLTKISSAGRLVVADDGEISSSAILTSISSPSITTTSTANNYGLTISGSNATTGSNVGMSFAAWGSLGFNGLAVPGAAVWFTRTGSFSQGYLSFLTRTGGVQASPLAERMRVGETGTISIAGFTSSSVGLIVKPSASPTANLTEWQDSSGNIISNITSYGGARLYDLGIKGSPAGIGWAYFGNDNTTTKNVVVRGYASQTANLQEWQNSAGTVLNAINSYGSFIGGQFDINGNLSNILYITSIRNLAAGNPYGESQTDEPKLSLFGKTGQTSNFIDIKSIGGGSGKILLSITSDGSIKGGNSSTISANTATTVDTVALSSFTTIEYVVSIKQGSKIRSSKVLVHTDGTSVDSTEYGIMEMGGGITGILVSASVSSTNSILQVTITDAATTNATVKLIKTML